MPHRQQPTSLPTAIAKLELQQRRQPILGFGGSQTFNGDLLAPFPGRDAVFRALFQDLRLDFYRLRNYHGYDGQQQKFDTTVGTFARGARRFGGGKERGGKAPVRLMFTAWSPPARLKSNNLVSGKSDGTEKGLENATLKRNANGEYVYDDYAQWWLESVQQFKKLAGVYPDYISLQNELDLAVAYEGCRFLPSEGIGRGGYPFAGYDKALAAVEQKLKSLGAAAPKLIGPEPFTIQLDPNGKNRVQNFVDPTTPSGRATLDKLAAVSFHYYGSGVEDPTPAKFHAALTSLKDTFRGGANPKPLLQTEYLEGDTFLKLGTQIHDALTVGDASAYFIWMSSRSMLTPGLAMVYFNPVDGTIEKRERYYAMKHFSAFVGEGWFRIEATVSDTAVKISAFHQPEQRRLVAVLINSTDQERKVNLALSDPGFTSKAVFRSSQGEDGERWRELGVLPPSGEVVLTRRSMVTVYFTPR